MCGSFINNSYEDTNSSIEKWANFHFYDRHKINIYYDDYETAYNIGVKINDYVSTVKVKLGEE